MEQLGKSLTEYLRKTVNGRRWNQKFSECYGHHAQILKLVYAETSVVEMGSICYNVCAPYRITAVIGSKGYSYSHHYILHFHLITSLKTFFFQT